MPGRGTTGSSHPPPLGRLKLRLVWHIVQDPRSLWPPGPVHSPPSQRTSPPPTLLHLPVSSLSPQTLLGAPSWPQTLPTFPVPPSSQPQMPLRPSWSLLPSSCYHQVLPPITQLPPNTPGPCLLPLRPVRSSRVEKFQVKLATPSRE